MKYQLQMQEEILFWTYEPKDMDGQIDKRMGRWKSPFRNMIHKRKAEKIAQNIILSTVSYSLNMDGQTDGKNHSVM